MFFKQCWYSCVVLLSDSYLIHCFFFCCGFIWDAGWFLDYWMIFFVPFLLHYCSVKQSHVLCCDIEIETFLYAAWRLVSAGVHLTFKFELIPTESQDQPIWKKGNPTNDKVFFHTCKSSVFRYCFEDNLQPYPKRLRCTRGADLSFYWPLCIFTICWPI